MIRVPGFRFVACELRRAILLLLALPAMAFGATGEAVFVRGDVRLIQADGSQHALAVGESIQAGQSVQAGADGYAHLRFPDGGFVGVRPGARFLLEAYATDPAAPGGLRVRYRLDNGSLRAITGQTVEQNKNRFRLNTPVAAVGVRGTDYVVQAGEDFTRASVNRGAIVMAPLGEGCDAAALGACETAAARTLTAGGAGSYLEYRAGTAAPEVKKSVPSGVTPSAPDEPAANSTKRADSSAGTVDTTVAATASRVGVVASVLPPLPGVEPPAAPPLEVVWGRWTSIAVATPTVVEQLAKGYGPAFASPVFGLLVRDAATDIPRQGVVGFNLAGSEAYVRNGDNLTAMAVRDATLTVDFGARKFDTRIGVTGPDLNSQLSASGKFDWQGTMIADANRSTMAVVGALAGPAARDAGYLFEKPLNAGSVLYGATTWRR